MPKISAIVPHWPMLPEHDDLLKRCVKSLSEAGADEIIVVVNEGTGMGKAINKGFELASGDYFIVSNNDCQLTMGQLQDMCYEDAIGLPDNMPGQMDLPRAFYSLPRWVHEDVGGYDEQFEVGYFEDDDLIRRWFVANIPFRMSAVQVAHLPGTTLDKMPKRNEIYEQNKNKFIKKWGSL